MKIHKQIVLFLASLALITLGAGCAGKTNSTTEQQAAGVLTFAEKDASKGILRGTYELQGNTITFNVVRGEATTAETKQIYPGVTSHSIDVQICDPNGFCFINGASGHALTKSTSTNNVPDGAQALKNFQATWALHNDLEKQDVKTFIGLNEELQSLEDASNQPPDTWSGPPPEFDPLNKKQSLNEGTPTKGVLSLTAAAATTYTHTFQTWRQSIVTPFAYHSSTYSKVFTSGGQPVALYYTCNHGACANTVNMSLYCSRNFTGRSSATIPMNTQCAESANRGQMHPTGPVGCCWSAYSAFPLDLSHVCNDDSMLQRDMMILGGAGPINAPYCSDYYLQGQAPYCW